MATAHHPPVDSGDLPRRTVLIIAAGTAVVLVGFLLGRLLAAGDTDFPAAPRLTATHARPAPSAPPLTGDWAPADRRVLTAVAQRASGGYPARDHKAMIVAGRQVCAMVLAGRPLSSASATLRVGYRFGGAQAAAVGAAAVEVYCPEVAP